MTWNFNMDEAPTDGTGFFYIQQLPSTQTWCGACLYFYGSFRHVDFTKDVEEWLEVKPDAWLAFPPYSRASDAKSVQSNPKVQPGNS